MKLTKVRLHENLLKVVLWSLVSENLLNDGEILGSYHPSYIYAAILLLFVNQVVIHALVVVL